MGNTVVSVEGKQYALRRIHEALELAAWLAEMIGERELHSHLVIAEWERARAADTLNTPTP